MDGASLGDEVRKALLDPDSEHYDSLFPSSELRRELLVLLLQHLLVGGTLTQTDESILPYLDAARGICTSLID